MTKYKNPQEWLEKEYPNKNQTGKIRFDKTLNFEQSGELIINGYPNLKEMDGYDIPSLTKLTISNCSQLEIIDITFFKNNQQLTLNNLPKLKRFDYYNNELLTTLDLSNLFNLERIYCPDNQLTEIKLPQGEKLEYLDLSNNNLNQDLSFLSHLVNLKELNLSNNKLTGSLEPLKNMSKLEKLYIDDTDIDSGLEYLPESVEYFECSVKERKDAKCKKLYRELKPAVGFKKTVQEWKKDNPRKVVQAQKELIDLLVFPQEENLKKITQLEKEVHELEKVIGEVIKEKQEIEKQLEQYRPLFNNKYIKELKDIDFSVPFFESEEQKKLTKNIEEKKTKQQILDQSENLLGAKRIFLNARQTTIKELQKCYNELAKGKYTTIEEVNRAIGSIGEIEATLGIPKAIEGVSTAVTNCFKNKFSDDCMKAFHQYLINDNKNILPCFDETYNSLIKTIQENKDLEIVSVIKKNLSLENRIWNQEVKLFNADYKVYEVANIWEERPLTADEMKEVIISLSKNLKDLKLELEQEERELRKWRSGELETEISSNHQEQTKLLKEIEELKQQLKTDTNKEQEMIKLKQELNEKEQQLEELKKENNYLTEQLLAIKEKELEELIVTVENGEYKLARKIAEKQKEIDNLKNSNSINDKKTETKTKSLIGEKVILDEYLEQKKETRLQNLLNEQQALQIQPAYGTPGSSK